MGCDGRKVFLGSIVELLFCVTCRRCGKACPASDVGIPLPTLWANERCLSNRRNSQLGGYRSQIFQSDLQVFYLLLSASRQLVRQSGAVEGEVSKSTFPVMRTNTSLVHRTCWPHVFAQLQQDGWNLWLSCYCLIYRTLVCTKKDADLQWAAQSAWVVFVVFFDLLRCS